MLVNRPTKIKFSNPLRSFWEGGHICSFNDVVSQDSIKVNKHKMSLDFANAVFPDRSLSILTKRNIAGMRK